MKFKSNPFLTAVLFASLSCSFAHAVDIVWGTNLGAGPWDWNTGTNWTGGTAPIVDTDRADLRKDWTAAAVINLSAPTITNGILFDDTGASGDVGLTIGNGGNVTNTLTLAGTTPEINLTGALSISAVIAGNTNWSKTGGGTLTLSGANTYSGTTTVSHTTATTAGIVVANASALGTGAVVVNGFQSFGNAGLSVNAGLTVNNTLTLKRGAGGSNRANLGLGAGSNWNGDITLDNTSASGTATIVGGGGDSANASIVSGNIGFSTLGSGITLTLRGTGSGFGKVSGSISLSTGTVQTVNPSNWEFSNASNTWGSLDISNASGIVTTGATNTLSSTGIVTSTVGGTLRLNNQAGTTAYSQTIAGLSGDVKVGLTTGTATLTLNTTADQSSSGIISGAINLVKSGSAKQTLIGVNTYTGSTTVNGGTLALGTTGVIGTGDLTVSSATLDLRKGIDTRVPTVPNLTLSDATLEIGLNINPDGLIATGTTSISGTNTLKLHGTLSAGTYTLIDTAAPLTGTFILDTTGVTPSGFTGSYSGAISGNAYILTVGGTATPLTAYWRGDVSSEWNDASAAPNSNWATDSTGTTDTAQLPGAITDVFFSTTGATNTATTLGANLSINSLIFESGTASVGGANTLTILAPAGNGIDVLNGASATLNTTSTVLTATAAVQQGGTLTVNGGGLGSGTLLVDGTLNLNTNLAHSSLVGAATGIIARTAAGTGTLTVSGTSSLTYAGAINDGAGVMALAKGGSSTLTLSGNSNYSGGTTISGGIVQVSSSNAVGNGTVAINGGQRLSLGDGVTLANAISIGANTSPQGAGILEASSSVTTSATLEGPITITNNAANGGHFRNSGSGTFDVKGVITSSVAVTHRNGTVTYWGGGTGYNAMTATGTVRLGADNGLATTSTLTLGTSGAATLDLAGKNQELVGIVKGANAASVGNSSTTTDSVLTTTGTSTFDGVITNAVSGGTRTTALTVNGGALTLGGVNTYTGNTTVGTGATLTLADNAQLRFAITATNGVNNSISGAGSATIDGDFNINTTLADASALTSGTWTVENLTAVYHPTTFRVISGNTAWTATGDVWTKSSGGKNYSFDEATGILTMTSSAGFDSWAASKGLTGPDAAFDADPDNDGIDNGLEFVLGGEPNPANPGSHSASLLPTMTQSGGIMTFTFKRKDISESDAVLNFQWSTDLTFPSPANDVPVGAVDSTTDTITVVVTEDTPDADTDTIVITVPAAKAVGGKLFGRLKAVKLP